MDLVGPITTGFKNTPTHYISPTLFFNPILYGSYYIKTLERSRNARLIYCQADLLLEFVENPIYHINEQIRSKCEKISNGIRSNSTLAFVGLGSFVWINL